MFLNYPGKKTVNQIFATVPAEFNEDWNHFPNKLIQGDNLHVLKALLDKYNLKSKIELVYIDPPFSTNNSFTIGKDRVSTISNSKSDQIAYDDNLTGAAFIEFLRERLYFIKELMTDSASIYLHIDYKIGHYVKIIMDEIFGAENFRNDITRIKCNPKNFNRKAFGNIKDLILFYSNSKNSIWNEPKDAFSFEEIERLFKKTDADGRKYTTIPLHAPGETKNGPTGKDWRGIKPPEGRHWRSDPAIFDKWDKAGLIEWSANGVPRKKIYADDKEGKKKQDIWEYKDAQYPSYPTEKNINLIKMIIETSSNPGDLVLDCFCGSGTTLQAAQETGRNWIGVDKSEDAVRVSKERLAKIKDSLITGKMRYQYLETKKLFSIYSNDKDLECVSKELQPSKIEYIDSI